MTWHELKPETRQVLLDAIDRAETAANSVSEAIHGGKPLRGVFLPRVQFDNE